MWFLTHILLLMIWFISPKTNYKDLKEVYCQAGSLARANVPTVFFEGLYNIRLWSVFLGYIS